VPLVRGARRERLADAFDRETAPKSEKALLEVIADGGEAPSLRGAAALLLAQRFAGSAGALVPLLGARETLVRQKACEALGVAHARPAADALWARSRDDRALAVRQAAALALAGLGDERAEAELARLAGDAGSAHLMQPHFALGRMYARRGDFAAAQRQFREVARLTPYFADALLMLADVTARLGDLDGARGWVDDVLALDAGNTAAKQLRLRLEPER
jgi:Flp pilus assembly protein TadD